jgi:cytochrome P450
MRETTPVAPVHGPTGSTAWVVTGYEEARTVLTDPRFSSDRFRHMRSTVAEDDRRRMFDERARAGVFIGMDPPEHTRYRKLLTGQFTVRRMRQLAPRVTEIVNSHIDAMLAAGPPADLVTAFALPVPSLVICELLGVAYDDRDGFQEWTTRLLDLDTPLAEMRSAHLSIRGFLQRLVTEKRAHPGDDLVSGLIHGESDAALTDDELIGISTLLLIGGHETTANMLGLGTFALLEHPDQLAALRERPEMIEGAVEELLRYLSIVQFGVSRLTTEPVELAGQQIPAGANVMISVPAANRDAGHWGEPDALDLARERSPHLAFGHGVHQCLGQQLARVEMTIGFTELLRRIPDLRLAGPAADVPLRTTMINYGVSTLPVEWGTAG